MSNLEQKAFESANKAFGLVEDMTWDMDKEFHYYHQEAFKEGYKVCQQEYEEKLRWIPVEEKDPECIYHEKKYSKPLELKLRDIEYTVTGYFVSGINTDGKKYSHFMQFSSPQIMVMPSSVTHYRYFL